MKDEFSRHVKMGKNYVLDKNVEIGINSTILPNLEIGENSLIGAGSVVTKDVEPNIVVACTPAKIIKKVNDLIASRGLKYTI